MKKYIFVLAAFLPLILLSCDDGKLDGGSGDSEVYAEVYDDYSRLEGKPKIKVVIKK